MANSSTIAPGSLITSTGINNIRSDILDPSTGHVHTGAADGGVQLAISGMSDYNGTGLADGDLMVWNAATSKYIRSSRTLAATGYGVNIYLDAAPVGANSELFHALHVEADYDGTGGDTSALAAVRGVANVNTLYVQMVVGVDGLAEYKSADITVADKSLYGVRAQAVNSGTGRITHAVGMRVLNPANSGGGTIDAAFGVYIGSQNGVATYSSAMHIEGSGSGNSISFGNGGAGKNAQIYSPDTNYLTVSATYVGLGIDLPVGRIHVVPTTGYGLTVRMQNSVGGSATTLGLHAINDDSSLWRTLAIDANPILLNSATLQNVGVGTDNPGSRLDIGAGALTIAEMTAPSGTANSVRIFAQDNGAGKTQLMAIFPSGAAQQILIEA